MADGSLNLFSLGTRGVNNVVAPTHLSEEELVNAQNVEVVSAGGEGALDQRAGLTRINASALNGGASVLMAHDIPSPLLADYVATLYAPFVTAGASKWKKSTDGSTWTAVNVPATYIHNPPASVAPGYFKATPRIVTAGRKMYFAGAVTTYGVDTIPLWSFDGVTAQIVGYIPPATTGVALATPAAGLVGFNGSFGSSTWTYKVVARNGAAHSIASAAFSSPSNAPDTLTGAGGNNTTVTLSGTPVSGATSYDVYRTGVGTSPNTTGLIGTIPIVNGAFTTGNGSPGGGSTMFLDGGLAGDGSVAPVAATGTLASNALVVLDMVTDGTDIYLCVMDVASTSGRILKFSPATAIWTQIGNVFARTPGNGVGGTLCYWDGSLNYGTYFGTGSGNTVYAYSAATPLPLGGIYTVKTFAASVAIASMAVFNGALYVGTVWLGAAGTAATVQKDVSDTWSTARTGPGTAVKNGYTSLGVFGGRLYAGWTSGDGSSAARIESTANGADWVLELALDVAEVPGQMVTFGGALYIALAKTTEAYNTKSRIIKRTADGTWSTADDPSDDYAGAIGVVYV